MKKSQPCAVYRSPHRDLTFLYIVEKDDFEKVPAPVMKQFTPPELVMELELTPERVLANAEVERVIEKLQSDGFYLQMPPRDFPY